MQVSKWGNSLAIRLPASVVEALNLKEGDEIEVSVAGRRSLTINKGRTKAEALEILRSLARPFPPDFKFDRNEANER